MGAPSEAEGCGGGGILGGVFEEAGQVTRVAPEEVVGFSLEAPDVLAGGVDLLGDLLQRLGPAPVEAVAEDEDEPKPLVLHSEESRVYLRAWVRKAGQLAGIARLGGPVGDQVHDCRSASGSVAGPHRGIEARGLGRDGQDAFNFLDLYSEVPGQRVGLWLAARAGGQLGAR